jgi:ubiquitin related modifier 1
MSNISLDVEFGGGLELLFSNKRRHRIELPLKVPANNEASSGDLKHVDLAFLVLYLRDRVLKERPELFVEKGTVWVPNKFLPFRGLFTSLCELINLDVLGFWFW